MAQFLSGLAVFLGLDSSQFQSGLDKATEKSKRFAGEQDKIGKQASANASALLSKAAALAAAYVGVNSVLSTLQKADQIVDLANAYDATVESVLGLNKAFLLTGGNSESAEKALGKLVQSASDAREGNDKLRKSFADLGISVGEVSNLNPDQLFLRVAQELSKIEDPVERNARAFELLGKSARGVDWKAFYKEYSAVADPELAKAIEEGAKAWDNVQLALKGVFEFAIKLLKPFSSLINHLADLGARAKELKRHGGVITTTNEITGETTEEYFGPDLDFRKKEEAAEKALAEKLKEQKKKADAGGSKYQTSAGDQKIEAERRAIQAALAQRDINEKLFAIEQKRIELAGQARYLTVEENAKRMEQLNLLQKVEAFETQINNLRRSQNQENFASVQLQIENIQTQIAAERQLSDQRLANIDKDTQYRQSWIEGWEEAFRKYLEASRNASTAGAAAFASVVSNMNSALDKFVDSGKISFGDLAQSIIKDLIKIQLKAAASQLFSAAFGGISNTLVRGANQRSASFAGPAIAAGGNPPIGPDSLVGEKGPELLRLGMPSTVIPNNKLAGMGSGGATSNYVTYNINALDSKSFSQMLAAQPQTLHAIVQRGMNQTNANSFN